MQEAHQLRLEASQLLSGLLGFNPAVFTVTLMRHLIGISQMDTDGWDLAMGAPDDGPGLLVHDDDLIATSAAGGPPVPQVTQVDTKPSMNCETCLLYTSPSPRDS